MLGCPGGKYVHRDRGQGKESDRKGGTYKFCAGLNSGLSSDGIPQEALLLRQAPLKLVRSSGDGCCHWIERLRRTHIELRNWRCGGQKIVARANLRHGDGSRPAEKLSRHDFAHLKACSGHQQYLVFWVVREVRDVHTLGARQHEQGALT